MFLKVGDRGAKAKRSTWESIEERNNFLNAADKSFKEAVKLADNDPVRAEGIAGLSPHRGKPRQRQSAKSHFQQAALLFEQTNDRVGQFDSWAGIADIEKKNGRYAVAEKALKKALSLVVTIGNKDLEAEAWYKLGAIQLQTGGQH